MSTSQLATDATSHIWFVNSGGELGSGLRCPVWQEAAYRLGSHRGATAIQPLMPADRARRWLHTLGRYVFECEPNPPFVVPQAVPAQAGCAARARRQPSARANPLIYLRLRSFLLPQCFLEPEPNIIAKWKRRQVFDLAALFGCGDRI
jgi:hypothetical protein